MILTQAGPNNRFKSLKVFQGLLFEIDDVVTQRCTSGSIGKSSHLPSKRTVHLFLKLNQIGFTIPSAETPRKVFEVYENPILMFTLRLAL